MASLLRQIVAGPRSKHAETGLDLCYVTPNIIATSGPSQSYPQRAYRNPLDRLVTFLDARHGDRWAIWEFRAEGTGYPDEAVHHRIRHYPWPDHHPPPFRLVPLIVASIREWLDGTDGEDEALAADPTRRVVVVHCKAGKGRSGTAACSYLVAACGWPLQKALDRFTERRMRPRFGSGVTIPSQLRWLRYVERWVQGGGGVGAGAGATEGLPPYIDRPVEILEIRVWGLRHGVKLAVEGYVDEGRRIRVFHTFQNDERVVVEGNAPGSGGFFDLVADMASPAATPPVADRNKPDGSAASSSTTLPSSSRSSTMPPASTETPPPRFAAQDEPGGQAVLFRPKMPVRVPTSDVNIALERRNRTASGLLGGGGLALVTSIAHVWFNVYFEGRGPEQGGQADRSGVFAIAWDELDGIKGSSQKGSRAAERLEVVWRVVEEDDGKGVDTKEVPGTESSTVPQMQPADWKGGNSEDPEANARLGLHVEAAVDADSSQTSSVEQGEDTDTDTLAGVKASGPGGGALEEGSAASSGIA